jgi:hypothetical protein
MAIPRGLAEVAVYPITGVDTVGTGVLLSGPRELSMGIDSTSDELEGGNEIIAKAPGPRSLSGGLEMGEIELPVLAILFGGTVGTEGSGVTLVTSHTQTDDTTPRYFQAIGQAPDTNVGGGAYRATILKAQAIAGLDETMGTNAWNTPSISIEGTPLSGNLIKREIYATTEALTTTAPA